MRTIELIASMDWLPTERTVGELGFESLRGTMCYQFRYDPLWLRDYPQLVLSKDLLPVSGWQYKRGAIFDFLQDALPDRWGRRLIDKRERLEAARENRLPRHLDDADYMLLLDDTTRIGALRLKEADQYIGISETDCPVPPIAHIREFVDLSQAFERADAEGGMLREQWLLNLYRQGSSLGGARPKANVRDTDGSLYIAKIPSVHDDYDVALWEHFAHCLAREAGIRTADTRLILSDGQRYHTLLTRRFDRVGEHRVHFASAMTLCGLQDGASADTNNGYLDIVDMLVGQSGVADVHCSLLELYRRVAFNILIGNHDDHFRNHGFLLTERGWEWSPAYDLNPTDMLTQSLLITSSDNTSSLDLLAAAASDYMLTRPETTAILDEVRFAVRDWRKIATRCGISPSEQSRFALRLDSQL